MAVEEDRWGRSPVQGLRVKDVLTKKKQVLAIAPEQTVEEAFELLSSKTFLSLPVKDDATGVFDLVDAALLLAAMFPDKAALSDRTRVEKFTKTAVRDAVTACVNYRVAENLNLDTCGAIDAEAPLSELVSMMWGGWRRVTTQVEGENYLISQVDVAKFVTQNLSLLLAPSTLKAPISQVVKTDVLTAKATDSALSVVSKLGKNGVWAVPLLDNAGTLVAAFSASDLRHLRADNFKDLQLNAIEYLKTYAARSRPFLDYRKSKNDDLNYLQIGMPHTCQPHDAFDLVLFKLLALQVHRLFVVQDHKPVGVVSLSDIMKVFLFGDQPPACGDDENDDDDDVENDDEKVDDAPPPAT